MYQHWSNIDITEVRCSERKKAFIVHNFWKAVISDSQTNNSYLVLVVKAFTSYWKDKENIFLTKSNVCM